MAGSISDYLEPKLLDSYFGAVALTPPATFYLALLTDSNTQAQRDAGTVTEVSAGTWSNYARAAVTNNTTNFPSSTQSGGTTTKATGAAIPLGTVTASGNVNATAWAFYDASSGGNIIAHGDLVGGPITIANGNVVSFAGGALTITID